MICLIHALVELHLHVLSSCNDVASVEFGRDQGWVHSFQLLGAIPQMGGHYAVLELARRSADSEEVI